MAVRVVLIDDHPLFVEGIAALLATRSEFQIEGVAHDGEEGIRLVRKSRPDLVIMDIRMPRVGGLEATRRLKEEMPSTRVIILTVSEDEKDLFEAVQAGAQGYLLKNLSSSTVLDRLLEAAQGEAVFTPSLASKALLALGGKEKKEHPDALTEREREVLEQLVKGYSNSRIAAELGLAATTVRFHTRNILDKLHAENRTQAAVKALGLHLVSQPKPTDTD